MWWICKKCRSCSLISLKYCGLEATIDWYLARDKAPPPSIQIDRTDKEHSDAMIITTATSICLVLEQRERFFSQKSFACIIFPHKLKKNKFLYNNHCSLKSWLITTCIVSRILKNVMDFLTSFPCRAVSKNIKTMLHFQKQNLI